MARRSSMMGYPHMEGEGQRPWDVPIFHRAGLSTDDGADNPLESILGLVAGLLQGLFGGLGLDVGGDGWGGQRSGNAGSSFMQGVSGGGGTPTTSDGGGSCAGGVCR